MTLQPHEQSVLDRLEAHGNPLGWKPKGRDEDGNGVLETILPAGPGKLKVCRMSLTPRGTVHHPAQVIDANV